MAYQYTSLAKGLYGRAVETICPDDADCTVSGRDKISSLISAGYAYIGIRDSSWSCDGNGLKELGNITLPFPKWSELKEDIPFQTNNTACTANSSAGISASSTERRYGFEYINDTYWYSQSGFSFFNTGESFGGKNVYFEEMGINMQNPTIKSIEVKTDDNYQTWDSLNASTMYIGRSGEPIVYIDGQDIISYVDVDFYGDSSCTNLQGESSDPSTFAGPAYPDTENYDFDNSSHGQSTDSADTPAVTPSVTPSISVSSSPGVTPTVTPSVESSPSVPVTPSVTPSVESSPAATPAATPTPTPTVTPS